MGRALNDQKERVAVLMESLGHVSRDLEIALKAIDDHQLLIARRKIIQAHTEVTSLVFRYAIESDLESFLKFAADAVDRASQCRLDGEEKQPG